MSHLQNIAGLTAGFLSIVCVVPYITSTIKGETKPHRVTWWVLSVLSFMMSVNQFLAGGGNTVWVPLCGAIGQLVLAVLSIRYGEGGWSTLDRICTTGVLISAAILVLFNSPTLALSLNLGIDFLAFLPTLDKARRSPETENFTCWLLYFVGSVINLFAVESWSSTATVLPIYLVLAQGLMVLILMYPYLQILQAKARIWRNFERYLPTVISMQILALQRLQQMVWEQVRGSELYWRLHLVFVEEREDFSRFVTHASHHRHYGESAALGYRRSGRRQGCLQVSRPEYHHSAEWL